MCAPPPPPPSEHVPYAYSLEDPYVYKTAVRWLAQLMSRAILPWTLHIFPHFFYFYFAVITLFVIVLWKLCIVLFSTDTHISTTLKHMYMHISNCNLTTCLWNTVNAWQYHFIQFLTRNCLKKLRIVIVQTISLFCVMFAALSLFKKGKIAPPKKKKKKNTISIWVLVTQENHEVEMKNHSA